VSTPRQQGGLSITTLAISAAASVAAAVVVHEVWKGGAIIGAAVTPVIVAVVSESLRRPVDRVTSIREERRTRTQVRPGAAPPPPAPELERADPFGIWREERVAWWKRRWVKVAVATGLLGFAIAAFTLTATELIFGDSVGSGGSSTTVFGGGSKKKSTSSDEDTKTSTTETSTQETAPTETVPPAQTAPPTTETVPPPTQTAPAPSGAQPAPATTVPPAETAPPTTPVPTP
jgi:hypothetical protein